MDAEQAKARKTKADLAVAIDLLDQQAVAIRQSLHRLKIEIAAGQIALDRGEDELEALRQHAVATGDPADAADVLEFRGALANFRGKIAEMRESLVGSAMLIPIIGQNQQGRRNADDEDLQRHAGGDPAADGGGSRRWCRSISGTPPTRPRSWTRRAGRSRCWRPKGAHDAATTRGAQPRRRPAQHRRAGAGRGRGDQDHARSDRHRARGRRRRPRARGASSPTCATGWSRGMQGVNQRAVEQALRP